ncbi:MAG: TonB-dependent receptor plug domain-containing protein [Flavobacteriaceae bacterium]|nr:TonB-dependent receptor plug domain-containing protein [Flavobacteriaceae bacterium]
MEYFLKASALIVLFYLCYKLLFSKETFFESNRWFLLAGLISACILPLVVIPNYIVQDLQNFNALAISETISQSDTSQSSFNFLLLIPYIYIGAVLMLSCRFLLQISALFPFVFNTNYTQDNGFKLTITTQNIPPFSFFNRIVYNPNQFNDSELNQIINHEKVHAKELHSIDMLMTEIACIVFWFNPIIWLYKKDLQQNLEFIADRKAQEQTSCKKSYQHLLLKTSAPNYNLALTNNFYNSLIKKRIVMLHKSKSNTLNIWKYGLIIPFLALFLMSFNTKDIYIENDNYLNSDININENDVEARLINKDFTDADLDALKKELGLAGLTVKFRSVKRNGQGEITAIKIDAKSNTSNANFAVDNDTPIEVIKIAFDNENNSISIGNINSLQHGEDFVFEHKDGNVKIKKIGNGSGVFVYSNDGEHDENHEIIEHEDKIVITKGGTVHDIKKVHKDKNVYVISGDDDKVLTEWKDKDGNVFIHSSDKHEEGGVWTTNKNSTTKVEIIGKGDKKIFITDSDGKSPLYVLNGKEITDSQMKEIDPNNIKTVNVIKGDAAEKKYGEKGKNGVVEINTKKKY